MNRLKQVRLAVACCLADVFRIYAPNAPYSISQTVAAFQLMVEELDGLASRKLGESQTTLMPRSGAGSNKDGWNYWNDLVCSL